MQGRIAYNVFYANKPYSIVLITVIREANTKMNI